MTNPYYNHGSVPADNSQGSSSEIRAEFDAIAAGFNKMPTMTGNGGKLVKVNAGETALETQSASALVAAEISGATAKATPVDADKLPMVDSADSFALKNFTFANLWTWIQSKLNGATAKTTPTGADTIPISDSAASGATKTLSFTNLVTYLSGLCSSGWNAATATSATSATTATSATNAGTSGTFTLSSTLGFTTTISVTCTWRLNNGVVSLFVPQISGTSNSVFLLMSGLPANIQPTTPKTMPMGSGTSNSIQVMPLPSISAGAIAYSLLNAGAGWASSGNKVVDPTTLTWTLD
ncbi:MAG TPA: hypothetical protein VK149_12340 [Sideroxyarcus sp.]|nr:hypothetical protein [Sideroxyarcus sp.]